MTVEQQLMTAESAVLNIFTREEWDRPVLHHPVPPPGLAQDVVDVELERGEEVVM